VQESRGASVVCFAAALTHSLRHLLATLQSGPAARKSQGQRVSFFRGKSRGESGPKVHRLPLHKQHTQRAPQLSWPKEAAPKLRGVLFAASSTNWLDICSKQTSFESGETVSLSLCENFSQEREKLSLSGRPLGISLERAHRRPSRLSKWALPVARETLFRGEECLWKRSGKPTAKLADVWRQSAREKLKSGEKNLSKGPLTWRGGWSLAACSKRPICLSLRPPTGRHPRTANASS